MSKNDAQFRFLAGNLLVIELARIHLHVVPVMQTESAWNGSLSRWTHAILWHLASIEHHRQIALQLAFHLLISLSLNLTHRAVHLE